MGNVPVATVKTMRTKGDSFETAKNNAKKVFFFYFLRGGRIMELAVLSLVVFQGIQIFDTLLSLKKEQKILNKK